MQNIKLLTKQKLSNDTGKNCFTQFITRIYWKWQELAASEIFNMFT